MEQDEALPCLHGVSETLPYMKGASSSDTLLAKVIGNRETTFRVKRTSRKSWIGSNGEEYCRQHYIQVY